MSSSAASETTDEGWAARASREGLPAILSALASGRSGEEILEALALAIDGLDKGFVTAVFTPTADNAYLVLRLAPGLDETLRGRLAATRVSAQGLPWARAYHDGAAVEDERLGEALFDAAGPVAGSVRACTALPLFGRDGRRVGVLVLFRRHSGPVARASLDAVAPFRDAASLALSLESDAPTPSSPQTRLVELLRTPSIAVVRAGIDGTILDANDTFLKALGFTRADLNESRLDWRALTPPDLRAADDAAFAEMQATGRFVPLEKAFHHKDGHPVPFLVSAMHVEDGGRTAMVVLIELGQLKRSQTTLNRAELFNKNLLEVLGAIVLVTDARGATVQVNRAVEQILGYAPDELRGRPFFELIVADEQKAAMQFIADTLFSSPTAWRAPRVDIFSVRTRSGTRKRLHLSATVVRDERGEVLWILATGIDVTERENAFAALRESEQRFRLIALQAHQLIYDFEIPSGRIKWLGAIEEITGYTAEEFATVDVDGWAELIHPEDRPRVLAELEESTREGADFFVTYRFRHKDGNYLFLEDRGTFLRSPDGAVRRMLGAMADVTERRRAEEALVQSQKLESLGLLAGGIAHDFNNLLTAMLCNVNLAQDSVEPASPGGPYLESIEASIRQAAALTRQVLAYAGKGHLVMQTLDLSSVVRDVVRAMGVTVARHAVLDVHLEEGLPLIEADSAQIQQVVLNLLTNANEAIVGDGGRVVICTKRVDVIEDDILQMVPTVRVRPGPHVLLEVADSGCGMSLETQKRIFDPFFTTKPKGHGLGLSALIGILRGHRAGIRLDSEVGRGTSFQLFFPVAERRERLIRSSAPPRAVPRARATVLVVDDDTTIRDVLRPMLITAGYGVIEARDGEEALETYRARKTEIDLVLMDVTMPRRDGRDACVAMRGLRPDARIILMSGYAHHLDAKVLTATGATAFLPKPFEMNDLLRLVRSITATEER